MDLVAMLDYELFGNPLGAWLASLAVFFVVWAVLVVVRRVVRKRLLGNLRGELAALRTPGVPPPPPLPARSRAGLAREPTRQSPAERGIGLEL